MNVYKRILVVDDEEQTVFVLGRGLRKLGPMYEVVTVTSGQEALTRFKEAPFDLVITDLAMPEMDGVELTKAMREIDPDARVIWFSAYSHYDQDAQQLGIYRYLLKPADMRQLRQAVQEGLETAAPAAPSPRARVEKSVLILDDNDSLRRLFSRAMKEAGYQAFTAATLQAARDLLAQYDFDVFLCDIHVGEGRGTDLLREQSAKLNQADTQIIMVSADPRYRDICAEMGIEFYIEKPVAIPPLVTLVNRLMAHRYPPPPKETALV